MNAITPQGSSIFKHTDVTDKILGGFYNVYRVLGHGFLEKIYVNALRIELERSGLKVAYQFPVDVLYAGQVVGEYLVDLIIEDCVIVEVKAVKSLMEEHEAQLLNYLKATPFEVGLLLNFGPKPEKKRRAYDNNRKEWWLSQHSR